MEKLLIFVTYDTILARYKTTLTFPYQKESGINAH